MFLLTHVLALSHNSARCSLLELIESVDTPVKLQTLLPLLNESLEHKAISLAKAILRCYTPKSISSLSSRSKRHIAGFIKALEHPETQQLALEICGSPGWFAALRDGISQQELFKKLVNLAVSTPSQGAASIRKTLASLPVSVSVVKEEIQSSIILLTNSSSDHVTKKSRYVFIEDADVGYRLAILLELLPQWDDMPSSLIEVLFEALALTIDTVEDSSLLADYLRHLILNGILLGVQVNFMNEHIPISAVSLTTFVN